MPRTVEGIVQAHQISRDRLSRGLPSWKGSLEFMTPLAAIAERHEAGDDSLTAQMVLDAFHAAAKEVREKVPQAQQSFFPMEDEDLENFVLTLEGWTLSYIENCPDILEEFNEALDRLYDWADVNRWSITPARN